MKNSQPSVSELNTIQAEWMALDPFAPEPEKQRVFRLMEKYPRSYVSGSDGLGVPIIHGSPVWPDSRDVAEALEYVRQSNGYTLGHWNGRIGQWQSF